jgi:hypothetical protein
MTVSHHHRIAQSPALRYLLVFLFAAIAVAPGISASHRLTATSRASRRRPSNAGNRRLCRHPFPARARYQKPVGIYWMQVAAIKAAGYGPTRRSGSIVSCRSGHRHRRRRLAWTGTNLFGGNAGLISGIILAAVMATAFEGRNAKADAMLLASCVIAQARSPKFMYAREMARRLAPVAADLWIAQGVGIIIKGPFTPLVSALTIGTLWIFERDGRWLRQLHVLRGLLIIAAIGLPWLVMTALRSGTAFLETSLGNDLLMKTVPGQQPHGAPPGYYVVTYSLFLWPFGVIALGAGLHALNRFREEPAIAFCLAWYMPFWLLFELIPTKQPHHVPPAYPGLLLLVGWLATQTREVAEARLAGGSGSCTERVFVVLPPSPSALLSPLSARLYLGLPFNWWSVPTAVAALVAGYLATRSASSLHAASCPRQWRRGYFRPFCHRRSAPIVSVVVDAAHQGCGLAKSAMYGLDTRLGELSGAEPYFPSRDADDNHGPCRGGTTSGREPGLRARPCPRRAAERTCGMAGSARPRAAEAVRDRRSQLFVKRTARAGALRRAATVRGYQRSGVGHRPASHTTKTTTPCFKAQFGGRPRFTKFTGRVTLSISREGSSKRRRSRSTALAPSSVMVNRRKIGQRPARPLHIVEADNANVVGYMQALVFQCAERPHRHEIIDAGDQSYVPGRDCPQSLFRQIGGKWNFHIPSDLQPTKGGFQNLAALSAA